jgi:hypothetical protein
LTIATKVDVYEPGEVILREGEMGDTFYILKSGSVITLKDGKECGKVDAPFYATNQARRTRKVRPQKYLVPQFAV